MIYALQKQFCSWRASAASKLTPARCGRRGRGGGKGPVETACMGQDLEL